MSHAVFLLWPAVEKLWPEIERGLTGAFEPRAARLIILENETEMEALIADVYARKFEALLPERRHRPFATWKAKAEAMGEPPYRLRVLVAELRGAGDAGPLADRAKERIRKALPRWTEKPVRVNLHASDSAAEADYLGAILLSDFNLRCLALRHPWPPRPALLDRLHALRAWCRAEGVDYSRDVCVVSGGALEAAGIRKSNDLDIILASGPRLRFGPEGIKDLAPGIDLAKAGYHPRLCDDTIILDSSLHFMMLGVKVASLEVVRAAKEARGNAKDRADLTLLAAREAA